MYDARLIGAFGSVEINPINGLDHFLTARSSLGFARMILGTHRRGPSLLLVWQKTPIPAARTLASHRRVKSSSAVSRTHPWRPQLLHQCYRWDILLHRLNSRIWREFAEIGGMQALRSQVE